MQIQWLTQFYSSRSQKWYKVHSHLCEGGDDFGPFYSSASKDDTAKTTEQTSRTAAFPDSGWNIQYVPRFCHAKSLIIIPQQHIPEIEDYVKLLIVFKTRNFEDFVGAQVHCGLLCTQQRPQKHGASHEITQNYLEKSCFMLVIYHLIW